MSATQFLLIALVAAMLCILLLEARWWWRRHRRRGRNSVPAAGTPDSPQWSWEVDTELNFTASSGDTRELIGYAPEELIGRPINLVMDLRELARAEDLINALDGVQREPASLMIAARHRSGRSAWFEVTVRSRHNGEGGIVSWSGESRPLGEDAMHRFARSAIHQRVSSTIADRLLTTAFQPIIDLTSRSVIGAEALSRFGNEPDTTPDMWFNDATEVGLGSELELLAVEIALHAAQELPEHLHVSINVSPLTCLDPRLAELILQGPIRLDRIVLELTEHSQVVDYLPLNTALHDLRADGLRVAVDDAGAGFASGQHILRVKPDVIKLDRAIVNGIDADLGQQALAASMVALAAHLGASVTAEGIETRAELRCVTALGVDAGQGYLLGRPTLVHREWGHWRHRQQAPQLMIAPLVPVLTADRDGDAVAVDLEPPASQLSAIAQAALDIEHDGGLDLAGQRIVRYCQSLLDALPDATAVLDRTGRIIAVNRAWRLFSVDNGGLASDTGFGVSYLDVCERAAAGGSADAVDVLAGLRAVLAGDAVEREWEYSCGSTFAMRWYISRLTAIGPPTGGVIASHVNISRLKRSAEELQHQALHDSLTGLANVRLFTDSLTEALGQRQPGRQMADVGVLYIDLDGFKPVNDAFGHAAGDELLLAVTHRLRSEVRLQDTVARLGGDEFAICAPRINAIALAALATRLDAVLLNPHRIHGRLIVVGASVGWHLATPDDTAATALHCADLAMYAVKNARAPGQATLRA